MPKTQAQLLVQLLIFAHLFNNYQLNDRAMSNNKYERPISTQGYRAVIQADTSVKYEDAEGANFAFLKAKNRLMDVNRWQDFTSLLLANFQLTDLFGKPLAGPMQEGNLFKINIPGPGTSSGQGFDWVYVESRLQNMKIKI